MLATILKYTIPAFAILLVIVFVVVGGYNVGKQEGRLACQAAQEMATVQEVQKTVIVYAKIDKSVPKSRKAQVKWMLALSKQQ
jgi:hypothetical protein